MQAHKNILIGCTGSVATIKLPLILNQLKLKNPTFNIRVVLTEKSKHFINFQEITQLAEILIDEHEWQLWKTRGDPVLHIELAKWADIFIIAPLDANTLGKMSSGICDNLLTCVARAWDLHKPLLFCPAMNTKMYIHPITNKQIEGLKDFGYYEVPSISKALICGDSGIGAMADVDCIVDKIMSHLNLDKMGH